MNELEQIIIFIEKQYKLLNQLWKKDKNYYSFNMQTSYVKDVYDNEALFNGILFYRSFIRKCSNDFVIQVSKLPFTCSVSTRIKTLNSIQFKIVNYIANHENGKIPAKKCINDILGIRVILNDEEEYSSILDFLKSSFPHLKIIFSHHGDYQAIHVYFGNELNTNFQWELQVWIKKYEEINYESHSKYKQSYTKWEKENK